YKALLHHFGSLARAREAAGLPAPEPPRVWNAEKVIAELRRLHEQGVRITAPALKQRGHGPIVPAVFRQLGGCERARVSAGIPPPARHRAMRVGWTPKTIKAEIVRLHQAGKPLAMALAPPSLVSAGSKTFGSWREAVEIAGIDYKSVMLRPRY